MVYIMKQNLTLWVRNPEFSFGGGFATSVSLRNIIILYPFDTYLIYYYY